jgi:type IV secretion system protein VirB1
LLDLALVLTLSAQCAPGVSPQTLAAIAHAESRFHPLAIGVNRGDAIGQPRTRDEAIRTARRLINAGANIDLGIAQINSGNLHWLGLSIEDAFDPCRNLAAAATVLRAGYRPASDQAVDRQRALRIALSRYNTGHPERGFRNGYVARVEAAGVRLGLAAPATPAPSVALPVNVPASVDETITPAAPTAAWDVFGRSPTSPVVLFLSAPQTQTWSIIP